MVDLTKRMIAFRGKFNLTQKKLAKLCRVSTQTICLIENGQQTPGKLTLAKIEEVLKNGIEHEQNKGV